MNTWSVGTFNEKIDHFSFHKLYGRLRENADRAIQRRTGVGLDSIIAVDFMDRIIAMPLEYIQGWLDGENALEWRERDLKMLAAITGGFVELLEQYPGAEIHPIAPSAAEFYRQYGYEIITWKTGAHADEKTFAVKHK